MQELHASPTNKLASTQASAKALAVPRRFAGCPVGSITNNAFAMKQVPRKLFTTVFSSRAVAPRNMAQLQYATIGPPIGIAPGPAEIDAGLGSPTTLHFSQPVPQANNNEQEIINHNCPWYQAKFVINHAFMVTPTKVRKPRFPADDASAASAATNRPTRAMYCLLQAPCSANNL